MSSRTNGVDSYHKMFRQRPMIEVDADVLDLGRRFREGDELWHGDPTMSLQWNTINGDFEVWAIDAEGREYIAWRGQECTPQMLVELSEWDWQRGSKVLIDRMARDAQRQVAAEESRVDELTSALADKLGWTMDRIFNGRRTWAFDRSPGHSA